MTRGAAISLALLALIAVVLIALFAWPTRSATDFLAGMVDPRVTQVDIQETICRRGWTRTVRPPREATDAIKRNLAADKGVSVRDYELDHVVPLDLGGSPLDLRNLRLQPWPEAHCKDQLEVELSKAVCMGSVSLDEARRAIARDWRAAAAEWLGPHRPQGCGDGQ